jgi:hypothetical protein
MIFNKIIMTNNIINPVNNGCKTEKYIWTQKTKEITLHISLEPNIISKDIQIIFKPTSLLVKICGKTHIEGEFLNRIKVEDSLWLINRNGKNTELVIEIEKEKKDIWWNCVFKDNDEPIIDTSKIVTEPASFSELDSESQKTAMKMLYDQDQSNKKS